MPKTSSVAKARKTTAQAKAKQTASSNKTPKDNASKGKTPQTTAYKPKSPTKPAPTGRKTTAHGKAPRAAALGSRIPKNPSPERAIQSANPTDLPPGWVKTTLGEICERVATIQPEADPDTEFTLRQNPIADADLTEFIECFQPGKPLAKRKESVRFKRFTYADLMARDKANLDIFWLKDDSLADTDNLPHPSVLFRQILEDLAEAMQEFQSAEDILLDDAEPESPAPPTAAAPGRISIKLASKKVAVKKIPAKKVVAGKIRVKKTVRKITRNR